MRRLLLLVMLSVCALACTDNDTRPSSPFSVKQESIEVDGIGGNYTIYYTLQTESAMNAVAVCDAEWITDIDNTKSGAISFRALPNNDGAERVATITLRHISTDVEPQVVVTQKAYGGKQLSLELAEIDYSECQVLITPADETMLYVVMMAEKSYLAGMGITSVEELVAADQSYFYTYITGDTTLEQFLKQSNLALCGEQSKRWQDLSPAKEYVIYAYGIYTYGDRYEAVTDVEYIFVESRLPERAEIAFDATITAEGPEVSFSVKPEAWDGYYAVQLVEDTEAGYIEQGLAFTSEAEMAVAEAFFYVADHLYYFEKMSAEEIMQQLGYRGEANFSKTLNANHRYMALIYAIDSDNGNVPMVVSKPQVEYFSTGTVERSDMTFEVEFSNIMPRSVDVRIVPSTYEQYTAVMMYAKNLPDGDKQEQLEYIVEKYSPLELTGIYEERIDQLPPATEFVIAVYGYYAGAATTDLFIYRFTTAEDGEGENAITEVRCAAYDLQEVAAIESYYQSFIGYADYFLSVEVVTHKPSPSLHFDIFPAYYVDKYGEDDIRESLLEYSYTSSPDWALCTYGNEYVVCGLAEDENGFVGELFISEPIKYTEADTSAAEEFVELYGDYVPATSGKSSINNRIISIFR